MGFSTVSALVDHVRQRVDHSGLSDSDVLVLVQDAQRRILREWPFALLESKVTGVISPATPQTFTLPTDLRTPTHLYVYSSGEPDLVSACTFFVGHAMYGGSTAAMLPEKWAIYGGVGYLFPDLTSAVQYGLYYHKHLGEVALNSSSALLEQAPEVLEWATIGEYYSSVGELKMSEAYLQKAADAVKALIREGQWADEAGMDMVPTTPGSLNRKRG